MFNKEWIACYLLLILVACRKEKVYEVPKEIEPYFHRFIAEAKQRSVIIEPNSLVISFEENIRDENGNSANGKCIRSFLHLKPPHIKLDTTLGWWNGLTTYAFNRTSDIYEINRPVSGLFPKDSVDLSRERVIFHELAHALLGRDHKLDTLPNGFAASLMAISAPATYVYNPQCRKYYIDELFNPQTPPPCWAYDAAINGLSVEALDSLLPVFSQTAFTNVMVTMGKIWLSGPQGLCQYKEKNKFVLYDRNNSNLPGDAVIFRSDKNGTIWALTQSHQLLFQQEEEFKSFTLQHLPKLFINDFTFDGNNTLWLATDKGLIQYTDGNSFNIYNSTNTNLPNSHILKINIDKENRLWVMYSNGGIALKVNETHFVIYDEVKYSRAGISSGTSTFVATDKNNVVWTLSNKGELIKINGQTGSFEKVHVLGCQYPDVYITALQTSESGDIWIGYIKGTNVGVARYEDNTTFTAFPLSRRKQLLHIPVQNENELIQQINFGNQGDIWIAGSSGVIKVNVSVKFEQ